MPDEVDDQAELTAISSLVFSEHDRKWNDIAHYTREGCSDPQFLFILGRLIDPRKSFHNVSLKVVRRAGRPKELDRGTNVHVLVRLLHDTCRAGRGLELIASEIEANGLQDEQLRNDISDMFSRPTGSPLGIRFDVGRTGRGKPANANKLDAQNFLELHSEIFGEKTTDVVVAASFIHGLDVETARKYLQFRRGVRKRDKFWSLEFERQVAYSMRERGYSEYQPLREVLKKNADLYPLPNAGDL